MLKLNSETREQILDLFRTKRITLEGNILKLIDPGEDEEFQNYIKDALEKDKEMRRKRLEITRQVQSQNVDLVKWKDENEKVQLQLTQSLHDLEIAKDEADTARAQAEIARVDAEKARAAAENARTLAENDLEMLQRKSQFALMGTIVKVSLSIIVGVGLLTTLIYIFAMYTGKDTHTASSTWGNTVSILLTNAFSIVGTIMGVKYASEKNKE